MQVFPQMKCRKCATENPMTYFAPVDGYADGSVSVICFDCAKSRGWLTGEGNLKEGVQL